MKPRIVIVGGGFGGLEVAKGLCGSESEVTLVDKNNYHLFQPLLYQVAAAALSPADIAFPIRSAFNQCTNINVMLGEVTRIDLHRRFIEIDSDRELLYDQLVIATGMVDNYFSHQEWASVAPGLKSLEAAVLIRSKILRSFEAAQLEADPLARRALLTFVIVGGGPTGVELAGAIKELAVDAIARDFPDSDMRTARVILIQGASRLLEHMPPSLSARAAHDLQELGVELMIGRSVQRVSELGVATTDEFIPSRNVIWAAGVRAVPLTAGLGVPIDKGGRIVVDGELRIPSHQEVFVIGDTAAAIDRQTGLPVPGVAQGAIQMGRYVAERIKAELRGQRWRRGDFSYRDKGDLATIGRSRAVGIIKGVRVTGLVAWLVWSIVHLAFLVGVKNRLVVLLSWIQSYIFFRRGARLIMGERVSEMLKPLHHSEGEEEFHPPTPDGAPPASQFPPGGRGEGSGWDPHPPAR